MHPSEIKNLIKRSGISAIVYSGKSEDVVNEATLNLDFIEYKINMDTLRHDENILSLNLLVQEGKELVQSGVRNILTRN